LTLPYDNIYFSEVSMWSKWYDYETDIEYNEEATCNNPEQVQLMVDSLDSGTPFEFNCAGRSWRIFTCNGERVMCLNCKQNCVETVACPGTNHIINPCMNNPSCQNRAAATSIVDFKYSFYPLYPEFEAKRINQQGILDASPHLNVTATRTSLSINANVTKAGTIYCAAFSQGM
jgi:hypothetical protein